MKHFFTACILLATLWGCSRRESGEGWVSLRLQPRSEIAGITKADVADYAALPAAEDFILELRNHTGALAWTGKLSEWSSTTPLMAGPYTMTARYGDVEEEGFGKPCFRADENFQVIAFETVPVLVKPRLANAIVRVQTGPFFQRYFTSASFRIVTGSGAEFDIREGEGLFLDAYRFTLSGTVKTAEDAQVTFSRTFTDLEPATCYTVLLEAGNVDGLKLQITFNEQVEVISIEEELN